MKKIVLIAAAAGLMSLAACNKSTEATTNNSADMMALDNTAMGMENTSDATSNDMVAGAMDNAAAPTNEAAPANAM